MTDITSATGNLLGNGEKDITGTTWLLGHDLKSPTAIIISTLEMVIALHEDDEDMAHTIRLLKGALVAARREYNMVCDLLDLARFELNQYELHREPADLGALLRQSLEDDAYSIEIKKIQIETDISSDQDFVTDVDIELIKRIPGIGFLSAQKIVAARKFKKLAPEDLKRIGIAYSRAKYFLAFASPFLMQKDFTAIQIKDHILDTQKSKYKNDFSNQLSLFSS